MVGVALPASIAEAKTTAKVVPAIVVFGHGQNPDKVGNCSAVVFVQWVDVPNTVSARAFYTFNGKNYNKAAGPPFQDTFSLVIDYVAPVGAHRIQVGAGWAAGPKPNDCSATSEKQKTLFGTTATVEVVIDVEKAKCDKANERVAKTQKKIADLTRAIKKAKRHNEAAKVRRLFNERSAYTRRLPGHKKKAREACAVMASSATH